jgi:hypothetical protein
MKTLTAFVTALALVGFGSAAVACEGNYKPRTNADSAQTDVPLIPQDEQAS